MLDAKSDAGTEYLHDASCARRSADPSRRAMPEEVGQVPAGSMGAHACWDTVITTDHNHVLLEHHGGRDLWVHRKGVMPARLGESGVIPGSAGNHPQREIPGHVTQVLTSMNTPTAVGSRIEAYPGRICKHA